MLLEVQKYLQEHSHAELSNEYSIKFRKKGDLNLFCYSALSPKCAIANECRGIIINDDNDVVGMPFTRFYNFNEPEASEIDWSSAYGMEKMDGTMVCLYNYEDKWRISTRCSIDAEGEIPQTSMVFKDLIWDCLPSDILDLLSTDYFYVFELTSPHNRIVTTYQETSLTLLSMRNRWTLQEVNIFLENVPFSKPKMYKFNSLDDVMTIVKQLESPEQEGIVVVDKNYNRIKIKSEEYLKLYKQLNNYRHNLVKLYLADDMDEFLSYFPEHKERTECFLKKIDSAIQEAEELWRTNKHAKSQKEFALKVKDHPMSCLLFNMKRDGMCDSVNRAWHTFANIRKGGIVASITGEDDGDDSNR